MSVFASTIMEQKYLHPDEKVWKDIAKRVVPTVFKPVGAPKSLVEQTLEYVIQRKFIPGGRYLYATGRPFHQVNNCLLMRAEDSREGWAEHMHKCAMGLMTGAGIGGNYSWIRPEGKPIRKTGGFATGPIALMQIINETGRGVMQGGSRRSALWAGLNWKHADIMKFIALKNWTKEVRDMKAKDFNFPATMDMTNISVCLDDEFFEAYSNDKHPQNSLANVVYWAVVERMLKTGEPGFSIDLGKDKNENLRNACTEITSADDSDVCNLGSVNQARIESLAEFKGVVECATAFLLAGTVYSDVPYAKVDTIRTKNRRLGLGIMGVHEWLLVHGKRYGKDPDLDLFLQEYQFSGKYANSWSKEWDLTKPVKTRAMAPNGTIGILAETSTCMEPFTCAAYKRRYLKGSTWHYQYVIDPVIKRLVDAGLNPDNIEDAYTLSEDVERRLEFQAHFQQYVDHGISSTVNLPPWGSETNNKDTVQKFGKAFMKYLPKLRGLTTYPDGARSGQPITSVKYATAVKHTGEIFVETSDICEISGKGGSCGS